MTPVVELRAARKRFGRVEALRGVDLTIRPGELVAMLGPNGAGKTTSISLMLGLRRPTGGQARLFGLDRSRCGVMLQESGTTGVLTVRELVDSFRAYYPSPLPADRAIALAGLDEKANARARTLSGGERHSLRPRRLRRSRGAVPRRADRRHGRGGAPRGARQAPDGNRSA